MSQADVSTRIHHAEYEKSPDGRQHYNRFEPEEVTELIAATRVSNAMGAMIH